MERDVEHFKIMEVDGWKYLVQHPQVEEAWDIGVTLMKMVGGATAAMASGARDESTAASALQTAIDGILRNIDSAHTLGMIKRLFKYVEVQGPVNGEISKLLLDEKGIQKHFRGAVGSMLKLAGEVIAFTHRDFFEALGEGVSELMKMVDEKTA